MGLGCRQERRAASGGSRSAFPTRSQTSSSQKTPGPHPATLSSSPPKLPGGQPSWGPPCGSAPSTPWKDWAKPPMTSRTAAPLGPHCTSLLVLSSLFGSLSVSRLGFLSLCATRPLFSCEEVLSCALHRSGSPARPLDASRAPSVAPKMSPDDDMGGRGAIPSLAENSC